MLKELFESAFAPSEIVSMFRLKFGGSIRKPPSGKISELANQLDDLEFCYAVLHKVSRSFAVVIQQLEDELRDAVCIFYLVLRGLDSVEDDMTYNVELKMPLLRCFYEKLELKGWSIEGVGDSPDYRDLMANFDKVINVYASLNPEYQEVIKDITKRMGIGMAEFVEKSHKTGKGAIETVEQYNLYCHYVAGLVGIGLSQLFSISKLEDESLRHKTKIANSMGLFLQKTNIIRDYLEDLGDTRTWWPKEIWSQYTPSLDWFASNPDHPNSRACLNHMVSDALNHIPDCIEYLSLLKTKSIFEFCAIPQIMAIATLAKLYDNTDVFKKVVKIRKGLSCKVMLNSSNMATAYDYFDYFVSEIAAKMNANPSINSVRINNIVVENYKLLQEKKAKLASCSSEAKKNSYFTWATQATTMCAAVLALWWWK